jgi:hypothetical protein
MLRHSRCKYGPIAYRGAKAGAINVVYSGLGLPSSRNHTPLAPRVMTGNATRIFKMQARPWPWVDVFPFKRSRRQHRHAAFRMATFEDAPSPPGATVRTIVCWWISRARLS